MANQEITEHRTFRGVRVRVMGVALVVLLCVAEVLFIYSGLQTSATYQRFATATDDYVLSETAANSMKEGSNYLTSQIRQFVATHDIEYLDNYFVEAIETRRRDVAVEQIEQYLEERTAHAYLERALILSERLSNEEHYAARLVCDAIDRMPSVGASTVEAVELSSHDKALSADQKLELASQMIFGETYQADVDRIERNIALCKTKLIDHVEAQKDASAHELDNLLLFQQVLTWILLIASILFIIAISLSLLMPIRQYVSSLGDDKPLPIKGARELRILADEYNRLYDQNLKHNEDLRRKAEHDHLTGIYNREVYERLLKAYEAEPIALLLIDVDYFKQVNDTYGHAVGDGILQKLGGLLLHTFRSTDYPCRIGGDEFAVIMTEMNPELAHVVSAKIAQVVEGMGQARDELPAVTLSIGVAFGDATNDADSVYKHADEALYRVKEAGRNGHQFYA